MEHGVRDPLDRRFRLRRLHGRESAALRGGLRELSEPWTAHERAAVLRQDRHHRRRHRRLLRRLSSRQDGPHRRAAARARASSPRGSTWHAAGLVGQLRTSANITQLLGYSVALYDTAREGDRPRHRLEAERRLAACLQSPSAGPRSSARRPPPRPSGSRCISSRPKEAQDLWPLMQVDDVVGAAFLPTDGQASPSDITMSLAKGARAGGVTIAEGVTVTGIEVEDGRVRAVVTDQGRIACDKLVICAGQWSREIGRMAGVNIPLVSVQHQYLITETIDGVTSNLPTLRDPDRLTYWKEEVGGLVMGGYEPNPKPWAIDGLPGGLRVPAARRRPRPFRAAARARRSAACRPCRRPASSSSSTARRASRPTATSSSARRPRCAASSSAPASTPSASPSGGGAGMALAEWVAKGEPPYDLWPVDIRRFGTQPSRHGLGAHPHARGLRQALHHGLAVRGISLRPAAPPLAALRPAEGARRLLRREARLGAAELVRRSGSRREARGPSTATSGRTGSTPSAASTRPPASASRVFDQTSFAKFLLVGRDAEKALSWIAANDVAKPPGHLVYTQMLNSSGGIECDLTVGRLSPRRILHRHRHRLRHARLRLDLALHSRRARCPADRCHLVLCRALGDGPAGRATCSSD